MTRDEWEAEQARRDLEVMRINQDREKEDRRREKEYREEAELRLTQRQLEVIKKREADEEAEKRIKMEIEFKQKELEFQRHKDREAEEEQQKRLRMEFEFKQKELEFKRHKEAEAAADEKRKRDKEYRDEAELRQAQLALEGIKKREAEAELEKRIKKELELKRLKEEEEAAEEKRRRDALAHDAVERYKKAEADRIAHEQKIKEQNDKEYKRRLHDDLLKSGLDEHAIEAILSQKKVQKAPAPALPPPAGMAHPGGNLAMVPALPAPELHMERHTYTRMARRYLSIETLRTFNIDFEFDAVSWPPPQLAIMDSLEYRALANMSLIPTGSRVCPSQALGPRMGARPVLGAHQAGSREANQQDHPNGRRHEALVSFTPPKQKHRR